jgi:hypothetical protein
MKRVRRRQAWILEWRAQARRGEIADGQLRREIRALEADIRSFFRELATVSVGRHGVLGTHIKQETAHAGNDF